MRHRIHVVALLAAALAACGRASQESRLPPSPAATAPSASASQPVAPLASRVPAASPSAAPRTDQIQVFFSTGDRLVGEAVTVNPQHPVRDALAFLVSGPRSAGHYTEIPKGTRLLGVERKGEVTEVNFNSAFFAGGGSSSIQLRLAQVVFTLTQLPGVKSVQFLEDGKRQSVAGGEGFPIFQPLTRESFLDFGRTSR